MCHNQLQFLLKQLEKDKEAIREYDAIFQYQLELGIIEQAAAEPDGIVYYLRNYSRKQKWIYVSMLLTVVLLCKKFQKKVGRRKLICLY